MSLWKENADGIAALKSAVASDAWTENKDLIAPHLREWRDKYQGKTNLMLMPRTTKQVQQLVQVANSHRIPLTPQGGNTGLVGGSLPGLDGTDSVLLSFKRMTDIQIEGSTAVAGAGVTISALQDAADKAGYLFPVSLASEGSCTVGGAIATNAGGIHVIRYGVMRQLTMGVEAVLADGSLIDETADLIKDNSGYRLTPLLTGSEGTLGLISKARLKLFPKERAHITGWLELESFDEAAALLELLRQETDGRLSVFEVMSNYSLQLASTHLPAANATLSALNYQHAPWSVLFEVGLSQEEPALKERLSDIIVNQHGLKNAVLAASEQQRQAMIAVREGLSAAQKHQGVSIKHDISLPIKAMPQFLSEGEALVQKLIPGSRPVVFGHLGDGNLHYNLMQPEGGADLLKDRWSTVQTAVHDLVHAHGGSLSAEHGIGRMKKADLARLEPARLAAMQRLKAALDPHTILNPGVII